METNKVYLDYAASTPVDPRVISKMLPFLDGKFGNPSSLHYFGQQTEAAVEEARETMAFHLHCKSNEIIFTSCGTESDNLALCGSAFAARKERGANHILVSPVEHHAISRTAEQLASLHGFELEYLSVDEYGQVNPEEIDDRVRISTAMVSVIHANNEIGTINPVSEIGSRCRAKGIPFHTDSIQAAAYLPIDVDAFQVDMLSLGAHKFYGPKGVGVLYIRKGTPLLPIQTGGGQEFGLRAGTLNVPYIVGMAQAFQLAQVERQERIANLQPLRDWLIGTILEEIPDSRLTGHPSQRLPNHASFVFKGVDGNALLILLDMAGFACSSGSACKTGNPEPSEVLTALGLDRSWALGSLRISLGIKTTHEQIERFLKVLPDCIQRVRKISD